MTGRPQLLTDVRVLECTSTVAGAYCGKLLADLGASVMKIEPPAGDPLRRRGPFPNDVPHPERGGLFRYLNTNKQGRVVDLTAPADAATIVPLVHRADTLVEDFQVDSPRPEVLMPHRIAAVNPRLTTVSVTHFGQTGPYAGWRGSEIVDFHMSGLGYLTPGGVSDPNMPPLKGPGYLAEQLAGLTAAVAALAAATLAERSGSSVTADVSAVEASAAMTLLQVPWYSYDQQVPSRLRSSRKSIPTEALPCTDGLFCVLTVEPAQWNAWVKVMGSPEWASDPALANREVRTERWDGIRAHIVEWASSRDKQEIAAMGQAQRVPVFPVNTTNDLLVCPQQAEREFFVTIDHADAGKHRYPGLPYHVAGPPSAPWGPAPLLGVCRREPRGCFRLSEWYTVLPPAWYALVSMRQSNESVVQESRLRCDLGADGSVGRLRAARSSGSLRRRRDHPPRFRATLPPVWSAGWNRLRPRVVIWSAGLWVCHRRLSRAQARTRDL